LQGRPGAYQVTRAIDHIVTPPTVQAALAERIDRLPLEQKGLLQIASVIGDDVPLSVLQPISEMAGDSVHRLLEALQAAEMVYEAHPVPRQGFAFKHPLTREAAYQSLLVERRRQLHAEVLATMEALYGNQILEHAERLAHHALQGARWEKAISYAQQAAEKAVEKSAYRVASRFLESALDALNHLPQDRETIARSVDIRIQLRPMLTTTGDFSRSLDHLREAERLAESIADQRRLARVMIQKSYMVGGQGLLDSGIEAAERACALANALDDEPLRISAALALAESAALRGDAQRVIDLVTPIISHLVGELRYERAGMFGTLSTRALGYLAVSHTHLGQFDKALCCCHEALAIAREGQREIDLAYCHYRLGLALQIKGDLPEAVASLEQGLLHCREARFVWLMPRIAAALGYCYTLMGQGSRAQGPLEEAIEQAKSIKLLMSEATATASLAHCCAMAGELDAATRHARRALDLARRYGYWQVETFSLRILGGVDAQRGDHIERAEAQLREALTLAEARSFQPQLAHCRLALGRVLLGAGQSDEARKNLGASANLYQEMGMTFWLPQVHAELARCGSPESDG
jgi:tetratricopeptide (TPR) repeat protein